LVKVVLGLKKLLTYCSDTR